jgi:hypothetical protein
MNTYKNTYKTTYKLDELDQAVEQLYRLRLLEGWIGCLRLESNGEELIISQFQNPNSQTPGYSVVLMLENWFSWGDFVDFYDRMDGKIEVFYEHAEFEVMEKEEAFNLLRDCGYFHEQIRL